jgi:hypothetical protein
MQATAWRGSIEVFDVLMVISRQHRMVWTPSLRARDEVQAPAHPASNHSGRLTW